jgi:N-formylglutamate amidohydrolase
LQDRIDCIHQPWHRALEETLRKIAARWGAALLIDLHSMPPLVPAHPGEATAQIVLGDRFGASCNGMLPAAAFAQFARQGWRAAHNRPYAGGHALERHAAPARGVHAMQIELCRRIYLDHDLKEPGAGFDHLVSSLSELVRHLADEVAALGRGQQIAQAAE